MKLALWAAQPLRQANARAFVGTWLSMMLIVFASQTDPDQAGFVRGVAMLAFSIHGFLHFWLTRWLQRESAAGVPEAAAALTAYRMPRRVSHLDLAMAWILLTIVVSLYRAAHPVTIAPLG